MQSAQRVALILLLMALTGLASQCSRKPADLKVRPIKPEQAAKLQDAYQPPPAKPSAEAEEGLSPERQEALGDLLLENRQLEGSLVQFLQLLRKNPERHDIRYKVGVIMLLSGQTEAARRELNQVLAAQPHSLEVREALGLTFLEEKQYPQAGQIFQEILRQDSHRPKTYHLLGITYLAQDNPREAIRVMEKGIALDDKNLALLTALGQAYIKLKDYHRALLYLTKARGLHPEGKKINLHLGMALAGLKRYPEAFDCFLKAGDEAQAYNNLGVHYFLEGRYDDAAKCFQRALDLRPTHYQEAQTNLQRALEKLQADKLEAR